MISKLDLFLITQLQKQQVPHMLKTKHKSMFSRQDLGRVGACPLNNICNQKNWLFLALFIAKANLELNRI